MKYAPLQEYLAAQRGPEVDLNFHQIEQIIGAPLPPKAQNHRAWWSNNPSNNVMTKAWLDAGYRSEQVDMSARRLVFRRQNDGGRNVPPSASTTPTSSSSPPAKGLASIFGALRGTIRITGDLTQSTDEAWSAEQGQ